MAKNIFLQEIKHIVIMDNNKCNLKWLKSKMDLLGNIRIVHANFSQYSSKYDAYRNGMIPNVFNPSMEGGALVDINIYNLYLMIELFGQPKSFDYLANLGHNGIDTVGTIIRKQRNIGRFIKIGFYFCFG